MSLGVAVLGTGKMGSALVRRLIDAGHNVTVWNRTRARAEEVGAGRVAATAGEAVAGAEVVISSLTGSEAVRATGGNGADVDRARPILGLFGEVRHAGALGSGARAGLRGGRVRARC